MLVGGAMVLLVLAYAIIGAFWPGFWHGETGRFIFDLDAALSDACFVVICRSRLHLPFCSATRQC